MTTEYVIGLSDSDTESDEENTNCNAYSIEVESDTETENTKRINLDPYNIQLSSDSDTESDEETLTIGGESFKKSFLDEIEVSDIFIEDSNIGNLNAATFTDHHNSLKRRKAYQSDLRNLGATRDRSKRLRKSLDTDDFDDLRKTNCLCGRNCFLAFEKRYVFEQRKSFHKLKSNEKRTYLISELKRTSFFDAKKQQYQFRYLYKDSTICAKAFEQLYKVGHTVLCDVRRQINAGYETIPDRRRNTEKGQSVSRLKFKAWFDNWKNGRGNPQPDSTDFHLAPGLKKGDVVKAYQEVQSTRSETSNEAEDAESSCNSPGCSTSNLFGFLQSDFDHVKKRKHVRFTKCSVCTKIDDKKKKAKADSRRVGTLLICTNFQIDHIGY